MPAAANRDDPAYWIEELKLRPHPEGGYFSEIYRAVEGIAAEALPRRFKGERCFSTSAYFLLAGRQFSAFHRLRSDEVWYYHYGCALQLYVLTHNGGLAQPVLGADLQAGETPQVVVAAGSWVAARSGDQNSFCLCGCMVAPGFEFSDFELADPQVLILSYAEHAELIRSLSAA